MHILTLQKHHALFTCTFTCCHVHILYTIVYEVGSSLKMCDILVYEELGNTETLVTIPDRCRGYGRYNIVATRPRGGACVHGAWFDRANIANPRRTRFVGVSYFSGSYSYVSFATAPLKVSRLYISFILYNTFFR